MAQRDDRPEVPDGRDAPAEVGPSEQPGSAVGEALPESSESISREVRRLVDEGDLRRALRCIADHYGTAILNFATRMLSDQRAAEDIRQVVFEQAFRDLRQWRGDSVRSWLFRIARNRCLDHIKSWRTAGKHIVASDDVVDDIADPSPSGHDVLLSLDQRGSLRAAVEECLARLPDEVQRTILLRFSDDELSYEDMSVALNVGAGTLRKRVERAIPSLRDCLRRKGWGA